MLAFIKCVLVAGIAVERRIKPSYYITVVVMSIYPATATDAIATVSPASVYTNIYIDRKLDTRKFIELDSQMRLSFRTHSNVCL